MLEVTAENRVREAEKTSLGLSPSQKHLGLAFAASSQDLKLSSPWQRRSPRKLKFSALGWEEERHEGPEFSLIFS